MAAKRLKNETKNISIDTFQASLKDIAANVQALIAEYGEEAYVDIDLDYGYYDDVSISVDLNWTREETAKEDAKRKDTARKAKASKKKAATAAAEAKELKDKEEYERLKEKFA